MKKNNPTAKHREKSSRRGASAKSVARSHKASSGASASQRQAPEPAVKATKAPSLRGTVRHGAQRLGKNLKQGARELGKSVEQSARAVTETVEQGAERIEQSVEQSTQQLSEAVEERAQQLSDAIEKSAQKAEQLEKDAAARALEVTERAPSWLRRALDQALALPVRLRNAFTNRVNEERAILERRASEIREITQQFFRDAIHASRKEGNEAAAAE